MPRPVGAHRDRARDQPGERTPPRRVSVDQVQVEARQLAAPLPERDLVSSAVAVLHDVSLKVWRRRPPPEELGGRRGS